MEKKKRSITRLVMIGIVAFATYGMLNHWADIKHGVSDAVNGVSAFSTK